MVDSVEVEAKTLEDAIAEALARLGARRDEVEIETIVEGGGGLFGFGATPAKVRVTRKVDPTGIAIQALRDILAACEIPGTVTGEWDEPYGGVRLDLDAPDDAALLVGRRGATLNAVQFLTSVIASRRAGSRVRVVLDIDGFRDRRADSLEGLARRAVREARETGRPVHLEEMPPQDRRIIHLYLEEEEGIECHSEDEGRRRHVVVVAVRGGEVRSPARRGGRDRGGYGRDRDDRGGRDEGRGRDDRDRPGDDRGRRDEGRDRDRQDGVRDEGRDRDDRGGRDEGRDRDDRDRQDGDRGGRDEGRDQDDRGGRDEGRDRDDRDRQDGDRGGRDEGRDRDDRDRPSGDRGGRDDGRGRDDRDRPSGDRGRSGEGRGRDDRDRSSGGGRSGNRGRSGGGRGRRSGGGGGRGRQGGGGGRGRQDDSRRHDADRGRSDSPSRRGPELPVDDGFVPPTDAAIDWIRRRSSKE